MCREQESCHKVKGQDHSLHLTLCIDFSETFLCPTHNFLMHKNDVKVMKISQACHSDILMQVRRHSNHWSKDMLLPSHDLENEVKVTKIK